mmetsp:Transcript_32571/g.97198  ORF Transcript_32571/g.97198 Transcript_32571/m.97198 type:complete len:248 (+) Transcript_32571:632-1375(+)
MRNVGLRLRVQRLLRGGCAARRLVLLHLRLLRRDDSGALRFRHALPVVASNAVLAEHARCERRVLCHQPAHHCRVELGHVGCELRVARLCLPQPPLLCKLPVDLQRRLVHAAPRRGLLRARRLLHHVLVPYKLVVRHLRLGLGRLAARLERRLLSPPLRSLRALRLLAVACREVLAVKALHARGPQARVTVANARRAVNLLVVRPVQVPLVARGLELVGHAERELRRVLLAALALRLLVQRLDSVGV